VSLPAHQQRDRRPVLLEIDCSGTVIDTHFLTPEPTGYVSGITEREAADACIDARLTGDP